MRLHTVAFLSNKGDGKSFRVLARNPSEGPDLYIYLRSSDLHRDAIRKSNYTTSISQILGKRVIKPPGRALRCLAFVVLRKPVVRGDEIARAVVNISLSSVLILALKSGLPYEDVLQPGRKLQLTQLNMSSEARKENTFQTLLCVGSCAA